MNCDHSDLSEVYWYPATNEDGWKCVGCNTQLGYRPDLDREHITMKAHNVLQDFHAAKLIYISNGTMGEIVGESVAGRCEREGLYDQYSILRFILEDSNLASHADFWKEQSAGLCGRCEQPMWKPQCAEGHVREVEQTVELPF